MDISYRLRGTRMHGGTRRRRQPGQDICSLFFFSKMHWYTYAVKMLHYITKARFIKVRYDMKPQMCVVVNVCWGFWPNRKIIRGDPLLHSLSLSLCLYHKCRCIHATIVAICHQKLTPSHPLNSGSGGAD